MTYISNSGGWYNNGDNYLSRSPSTTNNQGNNYSNRTFSGNSSPLGNNGLQGNLQNILANLLNAYQSGGSPTQNPGSGYPGSAGNPDTGYTGNRGGGFAHGRFGGTGQFNGNINAEFTPNNTQQQGGLPLILQTGGGKGGKKGQSNLTVLGGYGGGNGNGIQGFGNTGSPLFLQTGGGKGGKKGQSQLTFIGGYGNPNPNQGGTISGNITGDFGGNGRFHIGGRPDYGQYGGSPDRGGFDRGTGFNRGGFDRDTGFDRGGFDRGTGFDRGGFHRGGFIGNGQFNGAINAEYTPNNNGQFPQTPLILQTGGGKGGKKGQSNIVLAGAGYGFGAQGFGQDFGNTGGPLFLQTGGGKGGKKGQSNITLIQGYGGGGLSQGGSITGNVTGHFNGGGFFNGGNYGWHDGGHGNNQKWGFYK